jgi:hypothetical protein
VGSPEPQVIVDRLESAVHDSDSSEVPVPVTLLCQTLLLLRDQQETLAAAAVHLRSVDGLLTDLERLQAVLTSLLDDDDVAVRIAAAAAWMSYDVMFGD